MSKRDAINKAVLEGASPPLPRASSPTAMPFVAKVGMQGAQGLYDENQRLKAERANGRVILALDPKRIRFSHLADRDSRSLVLEDADFAALVNDLRESGQEYPIKVKPITDDPDHEYELVAGHRRLRACTLLTDEIPGGFPVQAILDGTASELRVHALKMWRENALRKNPSAWEQGKRFERWLSEGIFKKQTEIAEATHLDKGSVSLYLSIAELPQVVLDAFGDPRSISLRWGKDLTRACKEHLDWVTNVADQIAALDKRPEPTEVFDLLTRPPRTGKASHSPTKSESVKEDNKVLFTFSSKDGRFGIKLGKQIDSSLRKNLHRDLKDFVHAWLLERTRNRS